MQKRQERYVVLCGQVVGSGPFTVEYGWDGETFDDRKRAISHGFEIRGSDDFNIGVIHRNRLVRLDWMEEPGDTDPAILAEVATSAGLRD